MNELNNVDAGYNAILTDIRLNGRTKQERNAVCHSVFGATLRSDCRDGYPLVTGKFTAFKPLLKEWLGMLAGETTVEGLGKVWGQWGLSEDHTVPRRRSQDEYMKRMVEFAGDEEAARAIAVKAIETGELTVDIYDITAREYIKHTDTLPAEVIAAGPESLVHELVNHQVATIINEKVVEAGVDLNSQDQVSIAIISIYNELDIKEEVAKYVEFTSKLNMEDPNSLVSIDLYLKEEYSDEIITATVVHEKGYLGPVYGAVWRGQVDGVDQVKQLESDIAKGGNRSMIIDGWMPSVAPNRELSHDENIIAGKQVLPPCHVTYVFDLYDGVLNVEMLQRSGDMLIGVPFNHGHLGLWLESLAAVHGLTAGEIKHDITNAHVYDNQLEAVDLEEYVKRDTFELPTLKVNVPEGVTSITQLKAEDFELIDYKHSGIIDIPVTA